MQEILQVARRAAISAGDILKHYWQKRDPAAIEEKSAHDLVSIADREAEAMIRTIILAAFPDHAVIGEEEGLTGSGPVRWCVDPLDGTSNFLHGYPWWSVSIGVQSGSNWIAALVYNPLTGDIYHAGQGEGAYLNDNPVRVSEPREPEKGLIATGFPFRHREHIDPYLRIFKRVFLRSRGMRRTGSAALDLACVASGIFHGFFEFALSPWDIAAGSLLIQEAGGYVSDFNGEDGYFESGNIVAGSRGTHRLLLDCISDDIISHYD